MDRVSSGDGRSRLETLATARRFMGAFRGRGILEAKAPNDKEKERVRLQISTSFCARGASVPLDFAT